MSVRMTPFGFVVSYTANIHQTPKILTASERPIKLLLGVLIRGAPDTPNPNYGEKFF